MVVKLIIIDLSEGEKNMKKHRTPGDMPQEIRLAYAKIVGLVLMATPYPETSVVVVFYRSLHELTLKEKERRAVLEFMLSPDTDLNTLCSTLMSVELEEERNLLRFSLVEDIYHMLMADHNAGDEETVLFNQVLDKLAIHEEHIDMIRQMYNSDSTYLPKLKPENLPHKVVRQTAAGLVGLSVPVGMVAVSGERGLSPWGIASGLKAISPGKGRNKSLVPGLLITLAAGGMAWRSTKWLLHYPEWKRLWMLKRLKKSEIKKMKQTAKCIDEDILMMQKQIESRAADFAETDSWVTLENLLKRSRSLIRVKNEEIKNEIQFL